MARIKCPDCNAEISSAAWRCIACGYPIQALWNKLVARRELVISATNSKEGVFYLEPPFTLIQILPTATLIGGSLSDTFVKRCAQLNTLHFRNDSSAVPKWISNGVIMYYPLELTNSAVIFVNEDGSVIIAEKYWFVPDNRVNHRRGFDGERFIYQLNKYLQLFSRLFAECSVPNSFWLMVSLVGAANTLLASYAGYSEDLSQCKEERVLVSPIEFQTDVATRESAVRRVADVIWHAYGKNGFPPETMSEIL